MGEFVKTTNGERLDINSSFHVELIAERVIPIYTHSHPHPETRKVDCPRVRSEKADLRLRLKQKIEEAIRYYEQKAKDYDQ